MANIFHSRRKRNTAKGSLTSKAQSKPHNKRSNGSHHLTKGYICDVEIKDLNSEFEGICRIEDKVTFVPDVLPGETCKVRIEQSLANYNRATVIEIIAPSTQRITEPCEYANRCGGCQLQHIDVDQQRLIKQQQLKSLFKGQIDEQVWQQPLLGQSNNYRRKARIACYYDSKQQTLKVGFRQKRSKQLVEINHCLALCEPFDTLIEPLTSLLNKLSIKASIGHVQFIAQQHNTVVIRHLKPFSQSDLQLITEFAKQYNVQWLCEAETGEFTALNGNQPDASMSYQLLDDSVINFQPNDFIQINHTINRHMVKQALSWLQLQGNEQVLDLFCGLGNFSIPMAKMARSVTGVEGVQQMVSKAQLNAEINQLGNCTFYQADLEQPLTQQQWFKRDFDIVLLDPARAGAKTVCENIKMLNAKQILYISCNPHTLARDTQAIVAQGYEIAKAGFMDMFPHTQHMEMMVLFKR